MGKKTIDLCCYSCDIEFEIKFSSEDIRSQNSDLFCPFCGEEIEKESDQEAEDSEDEDEYEG